MDLDLVSVMDQSESHNHNFFQTIQLLQDSLSNLLESTQATDKLNAIDQLKAIRPLLAQVSSQISDCITVNDLVDLTKAYLLKNDEKSFTEFSNAIGRLQSALNRLLDRANLPTSLTQELREQIQHSLDLCKSGIDCLVQSVHKPEVDHPDTIRYAKQALKRLNAASEFAAGLADRLEDEQISAYFIAVNRRIKQSMPPLLAGTKTALLSKDTKDFDQASEHALQAVESLLPPKDVLYPERNLLEKTKTLNNLLRILQSRIGTGNDGVQSVLKEIFDNSTQFAHAIKVFAPFSSYPDDLERVWSRLANEQMPSLAEATLSAQQSPFTIIQSINLTNSLLLCYVIPELLPQLKIAQKQLTDSLVEFKTALTPEAHMKVVHWFNEVIVLAQALAQQNSDPKQKNRILDCCKSLTSSFSRVEKTFSSLDRAPHLQAMLKNQLEQLCSISSTLISPPRADSVGLLERFSGIQYDTDTETGKMLDASKEMAVELNSILNGAQTRSQVIKSARVICNQAHLIVQQSQKCAQKCRDKRLSEQIVVLSVSARTKSVQLKILCAVKAASDEASPADEQLTACALSLTRDLHSCITAVEIAKLC